MRGRGTGRRLTDALTWTACGALVVVYVLAPQEPSLGSLLGSAAQIPSVFRVALVVAGGSAVVAGLLGFVHLARDLRTPDA